jgi:hypothetical protein
LLKVIQCLKISEKREAILNPGEFKSKYLKKKIEKASIGDASHLDQDDEIMSEADRKDFFGLMKKHSSNGGTDPMSPELDRYLSYMESMLMQKEFIE